MPIWCGVNMYSGGSLRKNILKARTLIKRGREVKLHGSFTVEASFIVPIIITILILVMGYTLYLHDIIVTEVDAAHMAEEGRMGLSYGRVPYSTQIYHSGFNSEEELEALSKYMFLYYSLYDSATMQGKSEVEEIMLTEKGAEVCLNYNSMLTDLLTTEAGKPIKRVSQERTVNYPSVYASVTDLVYQMGRLLLEK